MKNSFHPPLLRTFRHSLLIGSAVCLLPSLGQGQVTWDGTTDPNLSGSWNTATNWSGDAVPTGAVLLGDVTTGDRTITVTTTPANFTDMDIVQTTIGSTNTVTLNANLNVNASASQWWGSATNATAGVSSVVLNLGGFILKQTNTANRRNTFANTINFDLPNGAIFGANGANDYDFAFAGDVNVFQFSRVGRDAGTNDGDFTFSLLNGATLDVGADTGTLALVNLSTSSAASATSLVGNFQAGSTTTVAPGGEIFFRLSNSATPGGNKEIVLTNSGNIFLAGSLGARSFGTSAVTFTNNGSIRIQGGAALLQRENNSGTGDGLAPTFTNTSAGVISSDGGGSSSTWTYSDDITPGTDVAFTQNGTIAVGGTSSTGLDGVGSLTLANFSTTLGTSAVFSLEIGGSAAGQFDTLTLDSGSFDTAASGETLNISLVNSFDPIASQTWQLFSFTNGTVPTGDGFSTLNLPSSANGSFSFDNNPSSPSFGQLSFNAVPEPSSVALLFASSLLVGLSRRRSAKVKLA
jgi:hypothetical protein